MKVGEKRILQIPSQLGCVLVNGSYLWLWSELSCFGDRYGKKGAYPDIPGGSDLTFDVELVSFT